jgi:hypothetical protein
MSRKARTVHLLALAVLLGAGFFAVWVLVGSWANAFVGETILPPTSTERLIFLRDGTPIITTSYVRGITPAQYRDLAGNPVYFSDLEPDNERWAPGVELPVQPPEDFEWEDPSWPNRLRCAADDRQPPNYWFFVTDGRPGGSAYLVGYDSKTRLPIGFMGTDGFRLDSPPPDRQFPFSFPESFSACRMFGQQFSWGSGGGYPSLVSFGRHKTSDIPPWVAYVLTDDGALYQVDLSKRTVTRVLANVTVRAASLAWQSLFHPLPQDEHQKLIVRTDEEILVLNPENRLLRTYTIPAELVTQSFSWFETPAGASVLYRRKPTKDVSDDIWQYWVSDHAGRVLIQSEVNLYKDTAELHLDAFMEALIPSPLLLDALVGWIEPRERLRSHKADSFGEALTASIAGSWPALVGVHLLSAGLAWLCYRRQVRYGADRVERLLWTGFVFALGLPGWVGYRFARSWPVLERCPACDASVPQDREHCCACATAFPLPARRGTEVFA